MSSRPADGDPLPPNGELIEVRVTELQQLFNAMDASRFRERDLEPDAEELIVSWAREAPRGASLALLVNSRQRTPRAITVPERGPVTTATLDAIAPARESSTSLGTWVAIISSSACDHRRS